MKLNNIYLHKAQNSTTRLTRLLNDILDLSRIEAKKMSIEEESFQLDEIVQSLKDIFAQEIRNHENQLHISIDKHVPQILTGDSTRLTQILYNLIGNALKYTQKGQIEYSGR